MACCNRTGGPKERLLEQLGRLVDLPAGAQVWGPRDEWAWRVVDRHGHETEPLIASRQRVSECLAAALTVTPDAGGAVVIAVSLR